MSRKSCTLIVMAACVILGAYLNSLLARDEAPSNWKALEKAYAQANVALAQARLAQAQSENQAVNGSVSSGMLAELQGGVQLTQERLRQIDSDAAGNAYAPQIAAAEDAVRALETNHAESIKANGIQANAVPATELRREEAEIAVAKARVAALKAIGREPAGVQVQWEIGQLQDQVRALWARPLIED
jgi:hypothetical protein